MFHTYIYKRAGRPALTWDEARIAPKLAAVIRRQGHLIGRIESLGFDLRSEAVLTTLTEDVLQSSEIEGEKLDKDQVRSSLARRLGLDVGAPPKADHFLEPELRLTVEAQGPRAYTPCSALNEVARPGFSRDERLKRAEIRPGLLRSPGEASDFDRGPRPRGGDVQQFIAFIAKSWPIERCAIASVDHGACQLPGRDRVIAVAGKVEHQRATAAHHPQGCNQAFCRCERIDGAARITRVNDERIKPVRT